MKKENFRWRGKATGILKVIGKEEQSWNMISWPNLISWLNSKVILIKKVYTGEIIDTQIIRAE